MIKSSATSAAEDAIGEDHQSLTGVGHDRIFVLTPHQTRVRTGDDIERAQKTVCHVVST